MLLLNLRVGSRRAARWTSLKFRSRVGGDDGNVIGVINKRPISTAIPICNHIPFFTFPCVFLSLSAAAATAPSAGGQSCLKIRLELRLLPFLVGTRLY